MSQDVKLYTKVNGSVKVWTVRMMMNMNRKEMKDGNNNDQTKRWT